ncbi:hypothetical protein O6H91_02G127500 [Diphasiastrum complanatum]|uniref:Uncharacterized protein n=1 Tax=Diphasiastrum complanatum TaxID=34168 RepID=A0ACC2EKL6_DIPCM|nr:hypothetical protein O6H91_02G127500 [Diphasiastrum complanatum]
MAILHHLTVFQTSHVHTHPGTNTCNALFPPILNRLQPRSLSTSSLCCQTVSIGGDHPFSVHTVYRRHFSRGSTIQLCCSTLQTDIGLSGGQSSLQDVELRAVQLAEDILSLRCCSRERLKFEIEYSLKRGTTDNSYVIKTEEGIILMDVPDQLFSRAYIQTLASSIDLRNIKSLIIGHFSPKRTESLTALGDALPNEVLPLKVYCSNPAAQQLRASLPTSLLEKTFSVNIIRPRDSLELGGGRKLQFILTPTPRWPDGMCSYDSASQLLFTNKLFSAHVCDNNDFDAGGWDSYGQDWQFYYDCMLAPVAKQAEAALEKLPLVPQFSKPSYSGKKGVEVIKADLRYIFSSLLSELNLPISKAATLSKILESGSLLVVSAWTQEKLKQNEAAVVAVIYASAYGNTAALAQAISRGISKASVGVESLNTEQSTSEEVGDLVQRCDGFVIGSPTLAGHMPTPIQNALGVILKNIDAKGKPCGIFGSFGWSGEAVDEIEQRLKSAGFTFAFSTIRCKFKPTESMLQTCEESGTDLAQAVKRAKLKEKKRTAPQSVVASSVEQAVGRVVGSLCVLSAKSGDAESAMLASWVSQASFVPPGLTIAVAKDRAVESLVLPGGRFVLNVLGEGKTAPVVKQLLKAFKPGESRFGELQTIEADNGGRIIADAIAWMECIVATRLEAGDHWVIYATVDNGQLQDNKTLTAMHYRKTGARY